jgi:hypothetical protein
MQQWSFKNPPLQLNVTLSLLGENSPRFQNKSFVEFCSQQDRKSSGAITLSNPPNLDFLCELRNCAEHQF